MIFIPREFDVNPKVFVSSGSAEREKLKFTRRRFERLARACVFVYEQQLLENLVDVRLSRIILIGYHKQFKNVYLDSLDKA